MAGQGMVTDENGVITEGKWKGYRVQDVLAYADTLESATVGGTPPPAKPAPAGGGSTPPADNTPPANPGDSRVDATQLMILKRQEDDDEAEFSRTVHDYGKFKEDIDAAKKNFHPLQKAQRGFHRMLYAHFKMQKDEAAQRAVFGGNAPAATDPPPAGDPPPQDPPPADPPQDPPADPPAAPPRLPAAAPPRTPAAASTPPGRREDPAGKRKPKLKANDKIRAAARQWKMDLDEYLIMLEDQGMTQDAIDNLTARRSEASTTRRSVYDRTR